MPKNELILFQIFACVMMTGLIWMVQLVHYPSFRYIAEPQFISFQQFHASRITWIVAPLMGIELITALFLFSFEPASWLARWNIISVAATWLLTLALSVPIHSRLSGGYALSSIESLVATNWPRTLVWSARTAVFFQLARQWLK